MRYEADRSRYDSMNYARALDGAGFTDGELEEIDRYAVEWDMNPWAASSEEV